MRDIDRQILDILADSGLELSPSDLAWNLDVTNRYASLRCQELLENDLVYKTGTESRPKYGITDAGRNAISNAEE